MAKGLGLRIFLAGRVAVEIDGVAIDEARLPGRQGRLLFAYLVAEQGRPVPRDELAEALWGESLPATWDKALTVGVSKLRGLLTELGLDGATALTGAFGCYRLELPEGAWVDVIVAAGAVRAAEEALAAGESEDAKVAATLAESLVQQQFLPGEDGAWVEGKRHELAEIHGRALTALADALLRSGETAEAVKWAEQALVLAPFRETGYRRLMEAHTAAGNRAEALRVYEQCRRLLAEELGAYPSPETESIYRGLLEAPVSASVAVAATEAPVPEPAPVTVGEREPKRRVARAASRRRVAVVAVTVAVTAAAVAGIELARDDGPVLTSASENAAAAVDTGSNRFIADVPVGSGPSSVAAGENAVWVVNAFDESVSRLDPGTGAVVDRVGVGRDPGGIAVGGGSVWVANSLDATVSRIDPQTSRVETISIGLTPTAVAADDKAVWVTNAGERSVTRIDAATGRVLDRAIPTGAFGRGIAVGGGGVWVTDETSGRVVLLDPRRGRVVRTVGVGNGPTAIAFGHGAAWVANSLDGTVSRIDTDTRRVTALVSVGDGPRGIAVGPDAVWVSSEFTEELVRIDPEENRVVERIPVGNRPQGLALAGDQVWFGVQASGREHRGGRLVVAGGGQIQGSIDPSYISWAGTLGSLSPAYDGLVGFVRRGGSDGTQLVPNLAESLPVITGGGTTYGFRLRRGIRYSNGTLVRASDFRRSVERSFGSRNTPGSLLLVVGAETCTLRPRTCDLSEGIRTDDAAGTIVFRLRRPDEEFLRLLTFAWPVPRGTPLRDTGSRRLRIARLAAARDGGARPVPSTGPYMVESYVPGRRLVLVRNPFFRVWSNVARPDGLPDAIELRLGSLNEPVVEAVERGRVDLAGVPLDEPGEVAALDGFRGRFPARVRERAVRATVILFLNTTKPPFDDVRVRRALNYAVDRAAIAASYGSSPTCQLRPPGTVGFRRLCPYTAGPNGAGEWRAPDLGRARRLVSASGTRGMSVDVWTYGKSPGLWEQVARGSVRALHDLGYRARIRRAKDLAAYADLASSAKTRGLQAGVIGWYGPPPKASSLLDLFRCSPPDWSFFCDPRIDARIDRASELDATDPAAAATLWEGIERDILDLAPWVPMFTPSHAAVISERLGNYQLNPEEGAQLDQLWIR